MGPTRFAQLRTTATAPKPVGRFATQELRKRNFGQLADMDNGAAVHIGDGFAQDFVSERRFVSFAEKEEAEHVGHRVALFPLEVNMRHAAGHISCVNEERRKGVRHHGAACAEDAVVANPFALDFEVFGEFRCIRALYFNKYDLLVRGKSMLGSEQFIDALEVFAGAGPRASRHEADGLIPNGTEDVSRVRCEFNARNAQFSGAGGARYERDEEDRDDED
jgi:hypothetical protein